MSGIYNYVAAEKPIVDLNAVEVMVKELEEYIVKDDVYRTILAPAGNRPGNLKLRMSGGDLLARLHRLQGERAVLNDEERQRLDTAQQEADKVIYSLRTRFLERLAREMKARLDSLNWFFDDWEKEAKGNRADYPFEIRNRQRIEEILKQFDGNPPTELASALAKVDRRIQQHTVKGDFIWDPPLEKVYPPEPYWYLYRNALQS